MPYTGWDEYQRLAWYAAKHFLETNERLAQDTSNVEAIADPEAEAERVKARIKELRDAERERYEDVPNPDIPETANI